MPAPDEGQPRRPHPPNLRIAPRTGDVVPARTRPKRAPREIDELPSQEDMDRFADPTRTCPECNKEVFDDAAVCYHCGHAFERTTGGSTRNPKWIVITVVLVLVAFVLIALRGVF
jgi:ribosomal protein S27E